jgi:hypothetical protein
MGPAHGELMHTGRPDWNDAHHCTSPNEGADP